MTSTSPPIESVGKTNLLAALLPEISAMLVVLWCCVAPWLGWDYPYGVLMTLAAVEAGTLMINASLVDVATRLQRPPPIWLAVLIVVGLMLVFPESLSVLGASPSAGWMMFLPLGWSVVERIRRLWTLPRVSKLDKTRIRVLTFDRAYLGAVIGMCALVGGFLFWAVTDYWRIETNDVFDTLLPWVLFVFFAANAWNTFRVSQHEFAKRPKSLLPWFDKGEANDMRPL